MTKLEEVKLLLETATTVEKAEQVMSDHTAFETVKEKIAFLKGMFGEKIPDEKLRDDSDEDIYRMLLNTIVELKN